MLFVFYVLLFPDTLWGKQKAALRPYLHNWEWRAETPFPPLSYTMSAPLWKDDDYEGIRQRLLKPLPQLQLTFEGADWATLEDGSGQKEGCVPSQPLLSLLSESTVHSAESMLKVFPLPLPLIARCSCFFPISILTLICVGLDLRTYSVELLDVLFLRSLPSCRSP